MNDGRVLRDDPETRSYMQDLDAQIDALEARLGETRQAKDELQQVLDAIERNSAPPSRAGIAALSANVSSRLAGFSTPVTGGRRWALGAAAAVVAIGAGLTFAGGNGPSSLPNGISLQDRVFVAEAADRDPRTDVNVIPAPLFTLDASDSPFDDAPVSGGPAGGSIVDMTASFDSPADSPLSPSAVQPTIAGDSASASPDEVFAAPGAFATDSASASASPEAPRSSTGSPDGSALFDSPDNT
jgi:hypothetical protein